MYPLPLQCSMMAKLCGAKCADARGHSTAWCNARHSAGPGQTSGHFFFDSTKKRESLNLNHCSKGSLCLQLCISPCKEMPGCRGGDLFLTRKVFMSLLGSLPQPGRSGAKASYNCLDFFFFRLKWMAWHKNEQKEVTRNNGASFSGWPKPR